MIRKVSAEDIAIRGNGTGLEYMCPTRHFVYIFFNPVFQVSTAKNEINLFNNHVLIVAPVTFAPAGAMTPSAEFLWIKIQPFILCLYFGLANNYLQFCNYFSTFWLLGIKLWGDCLILLQFNPCPAEPRYTLPLQTVQIQISWLLLDPDQLASEEANWSGSALFAIKYVNL